MAGSAACYGRRQPAGKKELVALSDGYPEFTESWVARGRRRYEWVYLYGFVCKTGEIFWLVLPRVDAGVFSLALSHFAREVGVSKDKRALLVLDRAGFHTDGEVVVPIR